nr:hypothetical transcript [Hymenolepis microstoma]
MAMKTNAIANDFDHSKTETSTDKKSSTLPFFIRQLEHAIKADNLVMANNQSQFIILKSREIEMLKDVLDRITNWYKISQSALQQRLEDRVVTLLKTALHLIEDVPTSASYAAFRQLVVLLKDADNPNEDFDIYTLRSISDEEKSDLIKKYIIEMSSEAHIPEGMQKLAFGGNDFQKEYTNGRSNDYQSNSNKYYDPTISSKNFPESISPSGDTISQKQVPTVAKTFHQLSPKNRADLRAGDVSMNAIRDNYFASKNDCISSPRAYCLNGIQKESLVSPHVPINIKDDTNQGEISTSYYSDYDNISEQIQNSQISSTMENQCYNGSESTSSMERERKSPLQMHRSNVGNDSSKNAPAVPWYYHHIEQGNPWKSRKPENSESKRSLRSDSTRQNIREFFLDGNEDLGREERRAPSKKSDADFSKTTPLFVEEPKPLSREEQILSRDSSSSSVSPFLLNTQNGETYSVNSNERSKNYTPAPNYGNRDNHSPSRSPSSVSNSEMSSAAVGVRERINEYQQRSSTASPAYFTADRKQTSEPTGAWVERLKNQLKQYMDPSFSEFDVIIRWLLTCGSRRDANFLTNDSSIYLSIDDILNRMNAQEDFNDVDHSRDPSLVKNVEKKKVELNPTVFDSKTYRPSIRKWKYEVRDNGAATVDKATAKSQNRPIALLALQTDYLQ